jgi:hypothetical protein
MLAMSAQNAAAQGGYAQPSTGVVICYVTVPNDEVADNLAGTLRVLAHTCNMKVETAS